MNQSIGFVGTGIMGASMAKNLAKANYPVIAWNRTRSKVMELKKYGIEVAVSLSDVARRAEVIITMVRDTPDVIEVVEGKNGLASGMSSGSTLIDMSTISPKITEELAGRLKQQGVSMLDAPVSGGSWGAQQGTLAIMVGGEPTVFEQCKPIFEAMGKTITLVGRNGMGQLTKLVNQVLVAGTAATVAEALVFAAAHGADLNKTIEAVAGGAAGSWQLSNLGPRMVQGDFAPGFMVTLQQKDLRLVIESAQNKNVPLAITSVARELFTDLESRGMGEEGTQAIIKAVEKLAGIEARQPSLNVDGTVK
jgi:3-hydroxyisobutyrate dehydrogenase